MGLSVAVGALAELAEADEEGAEWLREALATANRVLAENGLPRHHEPEDLRVESRASIDGMPYGFLHCLRRAYAHSVLHPSRPLAPLARDDDAADDPALHKVSSPASHLLYHSDCEGLYVPVDFDRVLVDDGLVGTMLGSSQRLLAELVRVAPLIDIRLQGHDLSDDEADMINAYDDQAPFFRERASWITLFEAARLSVKHGAAIVFQ